MEDRHTDATYLETRDLNSDGPSAAEFITSIFLKPVIRRACQGVAELP